MRHNKKFNHLGRKKAHRDALLANMTISLIEHKRIFTTLAKAKALRIYAEPIINRAKPTTPLRAALCSAICKARLLSANFSTTSLKRLLTVQVDTLASSRLATVLATMLKCASLNLSTTTKTCSKPRLARRLSLLAAVASRLLRPKLLKLLLNRLLKPLLSKQFAWPQRCRIFATPLV